MRKFLLAAVATAAIASPAVARDGSPYVGVDVGVMKPQDTNLATNIDFGTPIGVRHFGEGFVINHKTGFDVDVNGGYDLGMFRIEAELGYKHASTDDIRLDEVLLGNLTNATNSTTPLTNDNFQIPAGNLSILSGMVNALLDFGDDRFGGFAGAGAGLARVKLLGDSDSGFAWQGIAGLRYGISENLDVSLKYRFFTTRRLRLHGDDFGDAGFFPFSASGRVHTHSLLLGLTYNFAAPPPPPPPRPPPPPPPPPPPATQTCPDGSVILATDTCPPPPPPPPPPPVERGERGQ